MLNRLSPTRISFLHRHRRGRRWIAVVLLVDSGLAAMLAWCYRYSIYHIARLTWQRWTLPDEPQDIRVHTCPDAPWMLPTDDILGELWSMEMLK